jgi:sigma-B regulation protein RsbU (phosphoserine phosphatase)
VGVAIADVAGKGLPAALLMSNLQAAVRAFWHPEAPPRLLCENVNRLLCRNMVNGRFVTFCAVRLDCRTRTLTWSNAGHNPPLVVRTSGEVVRLEPGGTVMGVFDETAYREDSVPLARGDRIVLYTDGITEALSAGGEEFGEEGLVAAIRAHAALPASALTDALFADVLAFAGGVLGDDATLISVVVD